jgi:competence protein CoiA
MHAYHRDGIFVLWVLPTEPDTEWFYDDRALEHRLAYRASKWEKFLHALYFGRIYWHWEGAYVGPWHLGKLESWVSASEWYNVDEGEWQESGGYFKTSKIMKSVSWPESKQRLSIINDFKPVTRQSWQGGSMSLPASKIWIDKLSKWW